MHAAIMLRDFALTNKPQAGCTRLAAVRLIAKCADMFPLVSDYPDMCFLLDLQQLLLLLPLLLSRSHTVTPCDLKSPIRYARRGCHDCAPIAGLQLWLYFPASTVIPPSLHVATHSPSESSDDGSTAARPAAPSAGGDCSPPSSTCAPRSTASLNLNQLIESKALLQYPRP